VFLKGMEKIRKKFSRDLKLKNPKIEQMPSTGPNTFCFPCRDGVAVYQQCCEVAVSLSLCQTHHHEAVQPVAYTYIRSRPPHFSNRLTSVITGEVTFRSCNRDAKYFTLVPRTKSSTEEPTINFNVPYVRWHPGPSGSSVTLLNYLLTYSLHGAESFLRS
jgi:hypothetical protein